MPEIDTKSALKLANDAASIDRRLRLRVLAKLMGLCALIAVFYVGLASFSSDDDAGSAVATLRVTLSDLAPGDFKSLVWEARPVLVYRRTPADLLVLDARDERLRDAESTRSEQPEWARNSRRSRDPEWFVTISLGTDLGCSIDFLPAMEALFQGADWTGGFVDTCRKARYDLAGRVFKEQYAERNLIVPVYSIDGDELVLGRP